MIEDAIIVSTLLSAGALLFKIMTDKPRNPNNRRKQIVEKFKEITESTPQAKFVLNTLRDRLKILFPSKFTIRKKFTGILSSLNNRDIMSEIDLFEGDKSFTINKRKIYLCLKDRGLTGEVFYDYNSLIFVCLHEIAHVLCDEIGHTEKFLQIFEELLKHASDLGLYDRGKPFVKNYCE